MDRIRYVVITPVKDEEAYIKNTLESMVKQSIIPVEWIIVNDGSIDNTGEIINGYAKRYSWIRTIHRSNRGYRKPGGGVIEAFHAAYVSIKSKEWDYIVKLDGDLSFEKDYFENCFSRFRDNPKLGIGGGMIYHYVDGELKLEKQPLVHVRGATKIYKRQCWDSIGGLLEAPGWDTIDEMKANMLGYETQSFKELRIVHHRHTGTAVSKWANSLKDGRADYITGYHPVFMLLKCLKRLLHKPYVVGAAGLFCGYLGGYLARIPQVDDKALIAYVRQQQLRKLLFRPTIWK
jgi:biofilm PGA synthesis N-glycosyltransferase PgaC